MPPILINARFLTQRVTGVQRYAHELVAALDRLINEQAPETRGLRFVMLAPPGRLELRPACKLIELRQVGRFSGHIWEQLSLPFHVHNGLLFCPGNTAPLHTLARGRAVVTVHDLSPRIFPQAYSPAFRAAYRILTPAIMRRAVRVITVSHAERENILQYYPRQKERLVAVANGGLSEAWPQPMHAVETRKMNTKGEPPFVLSVGSPTPRKNIQGVLAAASLLREKGLTIQIVGGTAAALKSVPGLHSPENTNVRFLGHVDDVELMRLYTQARCLLFPSFYEASGIPPLEAMARGCPVVCSDIPALVERCADAALYCDPHDPADIAQKTIQAATDQATRARLIEKGRERVQLFSWKRCARQTLSVLRSALEVAPKNRTPN